MEDPVQAALDVEIVRDVVVLEPEAFVGEWAGEILRVAGQQRIEADDLPALGQGAVRTDASRAGLPRRSRARVARQAVPASIDRPVP